MIATKTGVLQEVVRRQSKQYNKIELKGDFPAQDAFINDTSRYIAACCTRRAGKSTALAIKFIKTMEKHPKSQSLYLALTQESAKQIMWDALRDLSDKYKLNLKFLESGLTIQHPNGAKLHLMGADLANFIRRLRGRKFAGVAIDEGQEFGPHLGTLINDILTPSISDYEDGWLALTGTPGPTPQGLFFDITQNNKYGYSNYKWSILDNPHMPNAKEFIEDLKKRQEWTDDNPTLLREWRGQWVLDLQSLWVQYHEGRNHYVDLPPNHKWNHVMGVDIGFKDADAIAIIAWSETCPETYLIEEDIQAGQTISQLVKRIDELQKKYNVYKIVMDEGGLGKKIGEEIRRRFGCPLEPADKANKQDNVTFLNDDLRRGKFKAKGASKFAQDSYMVRIDWDKSTPKRVALKPGFHSDIIDAVLYAFRESYAFTHLPGPAKPKWGTKEYAEAQETGMWEHELEGLQQEQADFDEIKRNLGDF